MLKSVISAISNAIYGEFGSNHKIYTDNIEQGSIRGSFLIRTLSPSMSERIMNRSKVHVPIVIQYFPVSTGKRLECYAVAEKLFQCLKYPEYDDVTYRGTELRYNITDDTLNFYVQYDFFAITYDPDEVIPTIDDVESSVNAIRKDDN